MRMKAIFIILSLIICMSACTEKKSKIISLKKFQLDNPDKILAQDIIILDSAVTSDGTVSVKIETERPITVPLFRVEDIDIENFHQPQGHR